MHLDPLHKDMYLFEVGFAYSVMGRYQDAISVLKQSLAAYRNNLGRRLILGLSIRSLAATPMRELTWRKFCGLVTILPHESRRSPDQG